MSKDKPPRIRADGQPDGRGHSDASKATRFAKGDGRARGSRTKGAQDERSIIMDIRNMMVTATLPDGRKVKVNTLRAILLKLRAKALAGDLKAQEVLLKRLDRFEPPSTDPDHTRDLLEEDAVILAFAKARGVIPLDDESTL